MRARLLIASLVAALTIVTMAPAARADDGGDAFVDGDGDPTAVADDTVDDPGNPGGSDDDCTYRVAIEDDFEFGVYDVDGSRIYSETGRWLERVCDGSAQEPFPEGGAVDPQTLALSARASVPIADPPMTTSPSADDRLYTQVTTWLWIDGDWWQPYSATATAGRVSSTVTATPTSATWDMGDGEVVSCQGPGVPWRRGSPDSATYCKHTYRHSSAGHENGSYTLAVTVTFEISWTSNTGSGGSLESIERSASRAVEVGEIQGLETE